MTNSCRGDQQVSLKPYKGLDEMEKYAQIRSEKFMGMTQNYDRLVGFCLAVTKEALDKTGGFDEQFITGNYEDEDLCMRIAQKGYALKIALDVFIHHWGSITFKNNNMDYDQLKKDNQKRFIKKWGRLRYLFLRLKNSKTVKKWINSINKRWSIS
jgi:GT2 family glycosyltransferase